MADKNLGISVLLDHYGAMLTDKQRDVIDLYYNQDLSLAEIAEHEGISRQGVRDNIKRGEAFLLEMEEKLHLAQKMGDLLEVIETVNQLCDEIERENRGCGKIPQRSRIQRVKFLIENTVSIPSVNLLDKVLIARLGNGKLNLIILRRTHFCLCAAGIHPPSRSQKHFVHRRRNPLDHRENL